MNHTKLASMPDMTTSKIVCALTIDHAGNVITRSLNEQSGRYIIGVIVKYILADKFTTELEMLFNTTYTKLELTVVDVNNDGKETTVSLHCDKDNILVRTVTCGNNKTVTSEPLSGMSYDDSVIHHVSSGIATLNVVDGEIVTSKSIEVCKAISTTSLHTSVIADVEDAEDLSSLSDCVSSTGIKNLMYLSTIISLSMSVDQPTNATIIILDKDMSDYVDFDKVRELLNGTINLLLLK